MCDAGKTKFTKEIMFERIRDELTTKYKRERYGKIKNP